MPRITGKYAYTRAVDEINKQLRKYRGVTRITTKDAHAVYQAHKGLCAFCGIGLNVREFLGSNSLRLKFYIPTEYGGDRTVKNLVPVCLDCDGKYRPVKEPREDIPDLNTVADLIEALTKAVIHAEESIDKPDFGALTKKVRRIKRLLNLKIEEIAATMRYKPFKDWAPESYVIIQEENNSIPDLVEQVTKGARQGDEDALSSAKDRITEQVKQTVSTRQYKIVRNSGNPVR